MNERELRLRAYRESQGYKKSRMLRPKMNYNLHSCNFIRDDAVIPHARQTNTSYLNGYIVRCMITILLVGCIWFLHVQNDAKTNEMISFLQSHVSMNQSIEDAAYTYSTVDYKKMRKELFDYAQKWLIAKH